MSLNTDILLDRVKLKSQIAKWRGFSIFAVVVLAFSLVGNNTEIVPQQEYVARINVQGIIMNDQEQQEILAKLAENERVKAIIMHVDSPGGTAVGGEALYEVLRDIRQEKPIVTVMGTLATSAGYMVAAPSDYIFARKNSITGSIGVIFQSADVVELAQKIGVEVTSVKSSPLKGSPHPFEKITPEVKAAMEELIRVSHNVFIDMVAESRDLPREMVEPLADGRVFTGEQAIALKLVDALGGEKEALEWLQKNRDIDEELKIKEVKLYKEKQGIEKLLSSITSYSKRMISESFSLQGLLSIWQGAII